MESQQQNGCEELEPGEEAKQESILPFEQAPRGCLSHLLCLGGWILLLLTVLDLFSGPVGDRLIGLPVTVCFAVADFLLFVGRRKKYVLTNPDDKMIKGAMLLDGPYVGNLFLTEQGVLFQPRSKDLSSDRYGISGGSLFFPREEIGSSQERSSVNALGKVVEIAMKEEEQKYQFKMNAKKRRELLDHLSQQNGDVPTDPAT